VCSFDLLPFLLLLKAFDSLEINFSQLQRAAENFARRHDDAPIFARLHFLSLLIRSLTRKCACHTHVCYVQLERTSRSGRAAINYLDAPRARQMFRWDKINRWMNDVPGVIYIALPGHREIISHCCRSSSLGLSP
jgi:hypothetical protein